LEIITTGDIAKSCSGEIVFGREDTTVSNVCIDSRKAKEGSLFIAIQGQKADGHDFCQQVAQSGATAVLVEKDIEDCGITVIKVSSTLLALQSLAESYRKKFAVPVIAVTGSVGKTTTKELCALVMNQKYKTLKNEGNLNSTIGMPLSVFDLDSSFEAAIFEMGMSGLGEIAAMSHIAKPDVGVITNIGVSHIEKLGSVENILKAKLEIENGMYADGVLVINGDDKKLWEARNKFVHMYISYGIDNSECDVRANNIKIYNDRTEFDIIYKQNTINCCIRAVGLHYVYNCLAATAAGSALGLSLQEAASGISLFKTVGQRQNIIKKENFTIIEDCYNASPDSMKAALDVLRTLEGNKKIAVLGDILELGKSAPILHEKVGKSAFGIDTLILYGEYAQSYKKGAMSVGLSQEKIFCFEAAEKQKCIEKIKELSTDGNCVLVKGSRGMKMEELIEGIVGEEG